jgi:dihydroorotase
VLMPCLTELFVSQGKLTRLEDFCSRFGAVFYNLPLNFRKLRITTEGFRVPEEIGGAVPLFAGKRLTYKVSCIE